MALPYDTKVVLPFDIATAQDMNERHANDVALAAGTGLDDEAVTAGKIDFATLPVDSWSPSFTGLVAGRYTVEATFQKVFNQVLFSLSITMTATSPINGDVTFTLPTSPDASFIKGRFPIGRAIFLDTGTAIFAGGVHVDHLNTDRVRIGYSAITGSNLGESNLSSSLPFTWTTNDVIHINGSYIAA